MRSLLLIALFCPALRSRRHHVRETGSAAAGTTLPVWQDCLATRYERGLDRQCCAPPPPAGDGARREWLVSAVEHHQPMTHRSRWALRVLLVTVTGIGFGSLVAAHGEAASPPPRVVAVVPYPTGPRLMRLDARTLRPVHGGWSRAVWKYASTALSPSGSRIAVAGSRAVLVLDAANGRIVRKYSGPISGDLYWLGGDDPWAADALIVAVDFGCYSSGCEYGITTVGSEREDGFTGDSPGPGPALEGALVFESDLSLYVFGRSGFTVTIPLRRIPRNVPFQVVADVARDRLFVISSSGLVAEIEHVGHKPFVSYHRVDLNGRPFEAAWAGAGKIALWGEDGLGTIDTRTWKTRAIAAGVEKAIATPLGIAAWSTNAGDGLTVLRPDGTRRFQVLMDRYLGRAQAVGGYLYVDTGGGSRYSVNLRTGEVVGPLNQSGAIISPTLVSIP